MKKIYAVLLAILLILCVGCVTSDLNDMSYTQESMIVNSPKDLFFLSLNVDANGQFIYPDTYAGMYLDDGNLVFLTTSDDSSEYQYLQDVYPNLVFRQAEYSMNYSQGLINDYVATYDRSIETVYGSYIDERLNRAVISIDEKSLLNKPTDPDDAPLIFELGSYAVLL